MGEILCGEMTDRERLKICRMAAISFNDQGLSEEEVCLIGTHQ